MHGPVLLQCVAVAMLIVANGFFVAAEFALVSVRDTRIQQLIDAHVPGARAVRKLQHDLDDFLPAVQLGVTLCSLALGWIGEPLAADAFQAVFAKLPHPLAHANLVAHALSLVAVALGFCAITYFHVVAGELVPKSLALRRAEALAVAVATPMLFFMKMARPAVRLLSRSAGVVLRGFDIPTPTTPSSATRTSRRCRNPETRERRYHLTLSMKSLSVSLASTPPRT